VSRWTYLVTAEHRAHKNYNIMTTELYWYVSHSLC